MNVLLANATTFDANTIDATVLSVNPSVEGRVLHKGAMPTPGDPLGPEDLPRRH